MTKSSPTPAHSSVRLSLTLPFCTSEVASYLFQPEVVRYWLGADSVLTPERSAPARLPYAIAADGRIHYDTMLNGTVTSLAWPATPAITASEEAPDCRTFELVVTLDPIPGTGQGILDSTSATGEGAADPGVTSISGTPDSALVDSPAPSRLVMLKLTPRAGQACRIRVEHSGLTGAADARASVKVWQGVLNRVGRLVIGGDKNRRRERQAVVVVHGIGEQRPGQLLRQFVASVFDREAGEVHFVKPDYVSSLFEMRMVTVPRNEGTRPTTDVYELYWAHLIRDTTAAQVYSWMFRLMVAPAAKIPHTLVRAVWGLRLAAVVAVLVFVWVMTKDVSGWLAGLGLAALGALPGLALPVLKMFRDGFIVGYAGDAARYLEPKPENIARRQDIRHAGAELLDALHDGERYSRIVVYGHSLGSVIAYDILSHAWAERSRRRSGHASTSSRALRTLEDVLNPRAGNTTAVGVEAVQSLQHAAWLEYRRNGFEWLVSDFVTAGSPLAHAQWLLNLDGKTQFADLLRERSFPACPPQTETVPSPKPGVTRHAFTFTHAYVDERNPRRRRSVQVPHHAGLFALTRWTNLYFPYAGLIDGDPIAGSLAGQFGEWVRDIRLADAKGFAHTRYTNRDVDERAAQQVRSALHLPFQRPLTDLAENSPQPSVLD